MEAAVDREQDFPRGYYGYCSSCGSELEEWSADKTCPDCRREIDSETYTLKGCSLCGAGTDPHGFCTRCDPEAFNVELDTRD